MTQYGFFFDSEACIGCKTCQMACKNKNNLPVGNLFRRVYEWEHGTWEVGEGDTLPAPSDLFAYFIAMACNHCENPACVAKCPVGAMRIDEEDGTVQHDDGTCIGCQSCVKACPYGVPQYRAELKITGKCDGCIGLRSSGEPNACVASCPMRALEFGDIDELRAKHPDAVDVVAALPDPSQTTPSVAIDAKPSALEAGFVQVLV